MGSSYRLEAVPLRILPHPMHMSIERYTCTYERTGLDVNCRHQTAPGQWPSIVAHPPRQWPATPQPREMKHILSTSSIATTPQQTYFTAARKNDSSHCRRKHQKTLLKSTPNFNLFCTPPGPTQQRPSLQHAEQQLLAHQPASAETGAASQPQHLGESRKPVETIGSINNPDSNNDIQAQSYFA